MAERTNSEASQTAQDFIEAQLQLEADAREILPYQFDTCTAPLGPLRQTVFSCLTCRPPPSDPKAPYEAAGVCYSCSIACHGEHELVELFCKRNFTCDCGTSPFSSNQSCTLRPKTAVPSEERVPNAYNQNFRNRFCGCGVDYDANREKGTMYQCLGLGTVNDGGCGEDWWHPECILGLPPPKYDETAPITGAKEIVEEVAAPVAAIGEEPKQTTASTDPPGFPHEDSFGTFLCYKCVDTYPWIKRYAGTLGFLPPVYHQSESVKEETEAMDLPVVQVDQTLVVGTNKRKASFEDNEGYKRSKPTPEPTTATTATEPATTTTDDAKKNEDTSQECKYTNLPPTPTGTFSLFMAVVPHTNPDDDEEPDPPFRQYLCKCPTHFPLIAKHPQLLEPETTYSPPLSRGSSAAPHSANNGDGARSQGSASIYDRGEAALSTMDRVRAIEGVMAYNHLRDNLKHFLKPFADSGKAVSAEDVREYFASLRGDDVAKSGADGGGKGGDMGADEGDEGGRRNEGTDGRKGQEGY